MTENSDVTALMEQPKQKLPRGRPRKRPEDRRTRARLTFSLSPAQSYSLKIAASIRHRSVGEVVRGAVRDYLETFSLSSPKVTLLKTQEVIQHIKQLVAFSRVYETALQAAKGGASLSTEERKRKRARMIDMGMEALEEVYKLTASERAAENSKYRMRAYMVLARLGMFNAAVLKDAADEESLDKMLELEEENERLDEMTKELVAEGRLRTQSAL